MDDANFNVIRAVRLQMMRLDINAKGCHFSEIFVKHSTANIPKFAEFAQKKRVSNLTLFHRHPFIYWAFRVFSIGAEDEVRTRDPQLGKLMLYQLSYFRLICLVVQK